MALFPESAEMKWRLERTTGWLEEEAREKAIKVVHIFKVKISLIRLGQLRNINQVHITHF